VYREEEMALVSLVYVSFANQDLSEDELREILKKARENNQKLDVTGMLLYRNGFFIQALEGEEAVVSPLYEKIKQDPRHRSVVQIHKSPIRKRSFEDWSMGFQYIENKDLEALDGFSDFLTKPFTGNFFRDNPSSAETLLYSFKQRNANRL
jgi:hypothetical protein